MLKTSLGKMSMLMRIRRLMRFDNKRTREIRLETDKLAPISYTGGPRLWDQSITPEWLEIERNFKDKCCSELSGIQP